MSTEILRSQPTIQIPRGFLRPIQGALQTQAGHLGSNPPEAEYFVPPSKVSMAFLQRALIDEDPAMQLGAAEIAHAIDGFNLQAASLDSSAQENRNNIYGLVAKRHIARVHGIARMLGEDLLVAYGVTDAVLSGRELPIGQEEGEQ
jgi:hypothetical protein